MLVYEETNVAKKLISEQFAYEVPSQGDYQIQKFFSALFLALRYQILHLKYDK